MDRIVYDRMAAHDSTHWWYRARRDILADYLTRYGALPKNAKILEIGCGTGHNLPMLAEFGEIDAIEIDPAAREIASERLGKPVGAAPLPELPGVPRKHYDLIAVLDVVEHIEDDVAALKAMADCLAPGGKILIAVPAHAWLWSAHDVVNHHHRRYSKATLKTAIETAGLKRGSPGG
jgi:SAM-dependent methyltransferase